MIGRAVPIVAALCALAFVGAVTVTPARPEPIEQGAIRIVDGDTVEARGAVVRLVGMTLPRLATAPGAPRSAI